MRHLTSIIFLLLSITLAAQPPAPDFMATDSDGQPHQLYADYLDEGKTVVIKLFFTYCPPCNAIAPLVEPLYESWGSGNGDVEFISLTTKADDSSEDVSQYKSNHGHTFPGVGADGGSLEAGLPYRNGTYGLFFGTPTFVVIAPDGTVKYNPRGTNMQATIDSVDAAIAATGASRPFVAYQGSGTIRTPDGEAIPGARLRLEGFPGLEVSTGPDGQYAFTQLLDPEEEYLLSVEKEGNSRNGVSTFDLILISRHILGVESFESPLQFIAGDANRDGKVTTLDIIFLRRLLLGIDQELSFQPAWIFVRAGYPFTSANSPFEETYNGPASSFPASPLEPGPVDWTGIKIGDINHDADPGL